MTTTCRPVELLPVPGPPRRIPTMACCIAALALSLLPVHRVPAAAEESCDFWVAPPPAGNDAARGTREAPWATLEHAAQEVPDEGATVCFEAGVYRGRQAVNRRFATPTTFRSVDGYESVFESDRTVVDIDGGRNIVLEGFEMRQTGPNAVGQVVNVDRRDKTGVWSERITLRNNILHDSFDDDILKVHNGVRHVTVEDNVFYNQADSDQHLDINSATDVVIQDNIFFSDFAGSGRSNTNLGKHFIVVKDSNEGADGLLGSRRIKIRRNVLLNWEGSAHDTFVNIGNDGKPYHEAQGVVVENNLLLGNSPTLADAAFGVRGARDVSFVNNTVVGDLPAKSYAYRLHLKASNPANEDITFSSNIWSDPTGTMGAEGPGAGSRMAKNDPTETLRLGHAHNLYWNGGDPIPPGEETSPHIDDAFRVVDDPELETDHSSVVLPYWTGDRFRSGNTTVREEFLRLVEGYAAIRPDSPAVDAADPVPAPADDILRHRRVSADIGAYEADDVLEVDDAEPGARGPDLTLLLGIPAIALVLLPGLLMGRRRPDDDGTAGPGAGNGAQGS